MKKLHMCAVALAAAATLGACGSGGSSSDDGKVAKIMVISVWDNPNYDFKDLPTIVKNASGPVNADGGINGQKISVVSCNAKGDPNEAERCARQAVSEKVTAVVGGFNLDANRIFPVLEAAKIPYIGGTVSKPIDATSEMAFPTAGGPLLALADGVRAAEDDRCSTISYLSSESTETYTLPYVRLAAKHYNRTIVKPTLFPDGATDMTPFVKRWSSGNPDCLLMIVTPPEAQQVLPAMKSLQTIDEFRGRIYTTSPAALTDSILEQFPKETEGIKSLGYFAPSGDAGWDDYYALQKKAGNLGKYEAKLGEGSEQRTYLAYRAFEQVAKTIKGTVNAKSMLAALGKSCKVDVGSVSPVLNFCTENKDEVVKRAFNNSFVWYVVKDGKYVQDKPGYVNVLPVYEDEGGIKVK